MRTPRKRVVARKGRTPIRDEVARLRRQVEQLKTQISVLRQSDAELHRGHDMSLRRFGELQLELDALKKTLES